MAPTDQTLTCPLCGQTHTSPTVRMGQRASCVRCGTVMAEGGRLGPHGPLALALTGLLCAVPVMFLPIVTLAKFGRVREVMLVDVFNGFSSQGFAPIGAGVLICGMIAPFALLVLLISILLTDGPEKFRALNRRQRSWAEHVQYWAMPEVQVLGILVAFFKLGAVVDATPQPGLYAYAGASLFMLLAWRSFKMKPRVKTPARSAVLLASP
jgi:paraquat-inducible protein A